MKVDRPTLVGRNVKLRAPCAADVDSRFRLGHDPAITEMFGASRDELGDMTLSDATKFVADLARHPHAWVIERLGSFIGESGWTALIYATGVRLWRLGCMIQGRLGRVLARKR